MLKRIFPVFLFAFLSLAKIAPLQGAEIASAQEYYGMITSSYQSQKWDDLVLNCKILLENFRETPFAKDAEYYLAVGYFYLNDYDLANRRLSDYLKDSASPKFFEESLYYKFQIAEKFREGAKKHIIKWEKSPQWLPAREDALKIYDEVINTLPYHELAAKAMFGKAKIHAYFEEFRQGIETLQVLIRRFPGHELSAESYLEIGRIYLQQCKAQSLDPDLLDSVEVNLRKFRKAFPGEERWPEAEKTLNDMKEVFAESLYETARFYERTKKPGAAIIYYSKVVSKFPETKSAEKSSKRLEVLRVKTAS